MGWTNQGTIVAAGSSKTSGTSIASGAQTTYLPVPGDVIVCSVILDNVQTTDGDSTTVSSVTDTKGNTYTRLKEYTNGNGTAALGITTSLWACLNVTATWDSATTITANHATLLARVVRAMAFTPTNTNGARKDATTAAAVGDVADPASMSLTPAGGSREYLWLYLLGTEGPNTDTDTTDSGNGWTRQYVNGTSGSTAQTNVYGPLAYQVTTASSRTVDWTHTAQDYAQVMVALIESSPIVKPGLIGATGTLYAPAVKTIELPGVLTSPVVLFTPTVSVAAGGTTVNPPLIAQTQRFAPSVKLTVKPPLISQTQAYPPGKEQLTVKPGLISQTQRYAPTVKGTVKPGLLSQTQTFAPTRAGTSRVYPPLRSVTTALYAPGERITYKPPLISQTQLFAPRAGVSKVFAPAISQTQRFTPAVSAGAKLPPLISQTQVYAPTRVTTSRVYVSQIAQTQLFAPGERVTVKPGLLSQTQLFTPTVTVFVVSNVQPPLISQTRMFEPLIPGEGLGGGPPRRVMGVFQVPERVPRPRTAAVPLLVAVATVAVPVVARRPSAQQLEEDAFLLKLPTLI